MTAVDDPGRLVEDAFIEIHLLYARLPGGTLRDDAEILWFTTGRSSSVFNGVIRTRLPETNADARIAAVRASFAAAGLPWRWIVSPGSQPVDLVDRLAAAGLVRHREHPAMVAELVDLPTEGTPPGITIRMVSTPDELRDWLRVEVATYGLDPVSGAAWLQAHLELGLGPDQPLRHYVGRIGDEPVAASTAMLGRESVGIYNVATLLPHRRRGFGRAVTLAGMHDGAAEGYRLGVLAASDLGLPVYRGLGFREVGRVTVFTPPAGV